MNRLFGAGQKTKAPNLTVVQTNIDERNESVEKKIGKLDEEIKKLTTQMSKMRDGPAKNSIKMKALQLLKRRKAYEAQSNQLANQSFNIGQTDFTIKSLEDTKVTVDAMKVGSKAMKAQMKNIRISDIDNVMDDLTDMMEDNNYIQEALGQNLGVADFDEDGLEAELMALGDDLGVGIPGLDEAFNAPSVPHSVVPGEGVPTSATGSKTTVDSVPLDEFGLPQIQ